VTAAVNNERSGSPSALNARKDECLREHPFTPENTYIDPRGWRVCRKCQEARSREHEQRRRLIQGAAAKRRASRAPGQYDVPLFEVPTAPKPHA
jgi:hypothetical protein